MDALNHELSDRNVVRWSVAVSLRRAEGVVRSYDDPVLYWIEGAARNRIDLFAQHEVSPHVG